MVVIQHSGQSGKGRCQYDQDSQKRHFRLFRSARAGSQASPQDRFLVMAAEMENAGSQELAQFWKEVPKAKVMEHRSVKHLRTLSDGLLPGCSGVTSPPVGLSLPQATLSCSGKCQTPSESAQGQSCRDASQRAAGAEHGGEFWWRNLVLLK